MATRPGYSHWVLSLALVGTFTLVLSAKLQGQEYQSPPEVLRDLAARSAADIDSAFARVGNAASAAEDLDAVWNRLVFYTVADALPGDELHDIRGRGREVRVPRVPAQFVVGQAACLRGAATDGRSQTRDSRCNSPGLSRTAHMPA